eukprot:11176431-Lingulodinium_polyedra.AAC.1
MRPRNYRTAAANALVQKQTNLDDGTRRVTDDARCSNYRSRGRGDWHARKLNAYVVEPPT